MLPEQLLRLIDALAAHRGLSAGTVGRQVGRSGDFAGRLRAGRDITSRRAARVLAELDARWPEDLPWPDDIPRPDAGSAPEEATR